MRPDQSEAVWLIPIAPLREDIARLFSPMGTERELRRGLFDPICRLSAGDRDVSFDLDRPRSATWAGDRRLVGVGVMAMELGRLGRTRLASHVAGGGESRKPEGSRLDFQVPVRAGEPG
jgi:hypothetical protein